MTFIARISIPAPRVTAQPRSAALSASDSSGRIVLPHRVPDGGRTQGPGRQLNPPLSAAVAVVVPDPVRPRGHDVTTDDLLRVGRNGHFLLESGFHTELWLDLDLLFLRPRALAPLVTALAGRLSGYHVDAVCG